LLPLRLSSRALGFRWCITVNIIVSMHIPIHSYQLGVLLGMVCVFLFGLPSCQLAVLLGIWSHFHALLDVRISLMLTVPMFAFTSLIIYDRPTFPFRY
jgi:hypothetical protein